MSEAESPDNKQAVWRTNPDQSGISGCMGDIGSHAAHFVLYAVLAALIAASIWSWKLGYQLRWVVVAAVIAALYGVSDEYHQTFVVGRSATITDVFTDAVGAIFSAAGLWLLVKLSRGRLVHE